MHPHGLSECFPNANLQCRSYQKLSFADLRSKQVHHNSSVKARTAVGPVVFSKKISSANAISLDIGVCNATHIYMYIHVHMHMCVYMYLLIQARVLEVRVTFSLLDFLKFWTSGLMNHLGQVWLQRHVESRVVYNIVPWVNNKLAFTQTMCYSAQLVPASSIALFFQLAAFCFHVSAR